MNFWGFAAFNSSQKGRSGETSNITSQDKIESIRLEDPQNQEPVIAYFEDYNDEHVERLRFKPRQSEQIRVDIDENDKKEELINSSRSQGASSDFDEDRIWHEYDRRCAPHRLAENSVSDSQRRSYESQQLECSLKENE